MDLNSIRKPIVELKAVNMIKNVLVQNDDTGEFHIEVKNVGYKIQYQREDDDTWYDIHVETINIDDDKMQ